MERGGEEVRGRLLVCLRALLSVLSSYITLKCLVSLLSNCGSTAKGCFSSGSGGFSLFREELSTDFARNFSSCRIAYVFWRNSFKSAISCLYRN